METAKINRQADRQSRTYMTDEKRFRNIPIILVISYWPELYHIATSITKGGWEIYFWKLDMLLLKKIRILFVRQE